MPKLFPLCRYMIVLPLYLPSTFLLYAPTASTKQSSGSSSDYLLCACLSYTRRRCFLLLAPSFIPSLIHY